MRQALMTINTSISTTSHINLTLWCCKLLTTFSLNEYSRASPILFAIHTKFFLSMAKNSTTNDALIPFKTFEEANKNLIECPPQVYDDLIKSLPTKSFGPLSLKLYRGSWLAEMALRSTLAMHDNFQCRPTDIFLASYPKSGTTWLKALVFAIMTCTIYPLHEHPLLTNNPHECINFLETLCLTGRSSLLDAIPFPRILGTHLPYSMLHDSIIGSDCKIVYIWRDPKDVLVSMYPFHRDTFLKKDDTEISFDEVFDIFCEGISLIGIGPIWDHVLSYWQESKKRLEKILFIKYEDMLHEPIRYLKMLAEFISCPFTKMEEEQGVVRQIVELCSFKNLKDLEVNKTGRNVIADMNFPNASFFRKGLVGDWRNHMTREMAQRIDDIMKEKFKGSGLENEYFEDKLGETSSCME